MNERVSIANMRFTVLTSSIIAAFSLLVAATPTPDVSYSTSTINCPMPIAHFAWQVTVNLITIEQFKHWLANTDADVVFHGKPIGDPRLSDFYKRNALDTMVTYCNRRIDNICGGDCQVYNGGPTCIDAPGTSCLFATGNVGFCDREGCGGSCNQFSTCGTVLEGNFCDTPGTASILVGT